MLDGKKLFIIIAVLAFLCVPAGFPAASVNNAPTSSKQIYHPKSKAAHLKKGASKPALGGKHAKAGKQKKASVGEERIGVFTAYTGTAGKKHSSHSTSDGTSLKENSSCLLANNSFPPRTKVFIESIGTCEVHDRIGKKTSPNHFDIHLTDSRKWAKNFGKQKLKYRIVSKPEKA